MIKYTLSIWQHEKEEFIQDVYRPGADIDLREAWRTKNLIGYNLIFPDDQDLLFFKLKYPRMKVLVQYAMWATQNV